MENLLDSDLDHRVAEKVAEIAKIADQIPGVVIIHNLKKNLAVEYMSQRGLNKLGITLEELKEMGPDYHLRFFNPEETGDYIPKLICGLLERNDEQEVISFFQQVRFHGSEVWHWHLSTLKILMKDDQNQPLLTITIALLIDPMRHITAKVSRLLDENTFLRQNYQRYSQLGSREREVLKLVVLGKSSVEIAQELFISEKTVNTHRRNIKLKLNANTSYDLSQYAMAFDLI
ncbi:response regulator transcription factor [Rufibacter quisquiliarum]|uniref:DNA-binding CsgD family transcriptional regulator n=1 Tax=Rufibacter quisquiliarum TaxID=1549639 RepID=A0A839GW13_9BACT|nr:LuxR C-terminal-related transcriptional regulator [Rufibacter quisquiliarum]MBA9079655.1 DNA-binding CsgD family transcriptional regulator [Rufibacter quisquiliarum]